MKNQAKNTRLIIKWSVFPPSYVVIKNIMKDVSNHAKKWKFWNYLIQTFFCNLQRWWFKNNIYFDFNRLTALNCILAYFMFWCVFCIAKKNYFSLYLLVRQKKISEKSKTVKYTPFYWFFLRRKWKITFFMEHWIFFLAFKI